MENFLSVLHGLSLALWVGGMSVFSFLLTPTFFQKLSREEAGDVVGLVFPRYFAFGEVMAILSLGSYLLFRILWAAPLSLDKLRLVLLLVMLAGAGVNGLYIGPRSHEIKKEMRAAPTEAAGGALQKRFGALHGASMAVNLLVILSGFVLLVLLQLYPLRP